MTLDVVGELRLGLTLCDPNRLARDVHRDGGRLALEQQQQRGGGALGDGRDGSSAPIPASSRRSAVVAAKEEAKQRALLDFGRSVRAQLAEAKAAFRAPLLRATLSGKGRGVRGALIADDFDGALRQAFRNAVARLHPRIAAHDVVITNVWDTTHGRRCVFIYRYILNEFC